MDQPVDDPEAPTPSTQGEGAASGSRTGLGDDFFASLRAAPSQTARNLSVARTQLPSRSSPAAKRRRFENLRPSSAPVAQDAPGRATTTTAAVTAIHRMSSDCAKSVRLGQAILDAAGVVKELVENALDARATRIDIRLEGKAATKRISVADNASGILPVDHDSLCLSHSTSKLSKFSDLDDVATYGFRGEAMSAVAALADKVTVMTRTAQETVGHTLVYGPDGSLRSRSSAPRKVGTTVQVDELFARLPVRLHDAIRHSSRDIARCLSVVQSYAIIASDVRFELRVGTVTRLITQPKPGVSRKEGMLTALTAVLGRTQSSALMPCETECLLDQAEAYDVDPLMKTSDIVNDGDVAPPPTSFSLWGFVSKPCKSGSATGGRVNNWSQFFYLNSRPVDLPRLTRCVNECFRKCTVNTSATPTCVLAINAPPGSFDVNVSPDKRQVMIQREAELITAIQAYLESVWSPVESRTLPMTPGANDFREVEGFASQLEVGNPDQFAPRFGASQEKLGNPGVQLNQNHVDGEDGPDHRRVGGNVDQGATSFVNGVPPGQTVQNQGVPEYADEPRASARERVANSRGVVGKRGKPSILDYIARRKNALVSRRVSARQIATGVSEGPETLARKGDALLAPASGDAVQESDLDQHERGRKGERSPSMPLEVEAYSCDKASEARIVEVQKDRGRDGGRETHTKVSAPMEYSFQTLVERRRFRKRCASDRSRGLDDSKADVKRTRASSEFSCTLQNVSTSAGSDFVAPESDAERRVAEHELVRQFNQEWFKEMKIIGQFNFGFIVCLLHDKDLFIVDQHASDEKYNYEDLERTTVIQTQRLLKPLPLDLAVEDELLVLEHAARFYAGGFEIEHRPGKPPTQRLYLRSQPSSKHTMFVIDDLREIISSLKDEMNVSQRNTGPVRPARVRAMFASRACRKSVMIGTALTKSQMRTIVGHLASLSHPWSCPHGRPTMRHLAAVAMQG